MEGVMVESSWITLVIPVEVLEEGLETSLGDLVGLERLLKRPVLERLGQTSSQRFARPAKSAPCQGQQPRRCAGRGLTSGCRSYGGNT